MKRSEVYIVSKDPCALFMRLSILTHVEVELMNTCIPVDIHEWSKLPETATFGVLQGEDDVPLQTFPNDQNRE